MLRPVSAFCLLASPLWAQDSYSCSGTDPEWTLALGPDQAQFNFFDRNSAMDIPQSSVAEGADWPRAMTLVGPRDSAIVILHARSCDRQSHEAQVLTQRGETPILLTGCCQIAE